MAASAVSHSACDSHAAGEVGETTSGDADLSDLPACAGIVQAANRPFRRGAPDCTAGAGGLSPLLGDQLPGT